MTTTAATTIQNVSLLSGRRRNEDLFDITLSTEGIDVARPGRPVQHMSWNRVSQWEVEERKHDVVLTLRGSGATTPLVVPGWSVDDLAVLMRDLTLGSVEYVAEEPRPETAAVEAELSEFAELAELAEQAHPVPPLDTPDRQTLEPVVPVTTRAAGSPPTLMVRRRRRRRRPAWKPVVTVLLLALAATAVTLVLLQSAGIINWSFLGPTS